MISPSKSLKYIGVMAVATMMGPAHATGGFSCSTTGEREISIGMSLSRTPIPKPVGYAIFIDGERYDNDENEPRMHLAQSWFDEDLAMIDVVDAETLEPLLALRTRATEISGVTEGTLTYQGASYEARCEFE